MMLKTCMSFLCGVAVVLLLAFTIPKDRLPDGFVELERAKAQDRLIVNAQQFIRVSEHPNNKKWTEIKTSDGVKYVSQETLEKFLNRVRNQQR
jgi:uncharacterized protein YlzI (FlbEa/FlbD family)